MVLSKLVLREFIEAEDLVSKKAQRRILGGYGDGGYDDGGYGGCGPGEMEFRCYCTSGDCGCHMFPAKSTTEALEKASAFCSHKYQCPGATCAGPGEYGIIGC